jgi:hypothetical protein
MKFRKRPVTIEARQLARENDEEIARWCGGFRQAAGVSIPTLEGTMRADWGDWIIQGVQGEFYPCKPDIFDATYEAVPDDPSTSHAD